jgi:hypothetical protein
MWRYAVDHLESFNVRNIPEIFVPGNDCDYGSTVFDDFRAWRGDSYESEAEVAEKYIRPYNSSGTLFQLIRT